MAAERSPRPPSVLTRVSLERVAMLHHLVVVVALGVGVLALQLAHLRMVDCVGVAAECVGVAAAFVQLYMQALQVANTGTWPGRAGELRQVWRQSGPPTSSRRREAWSLAVVATRRASSASACGVGGWVVAGVSVPRPACSDMAWPGMLGSVQDWHDRISPVVATPATAPAGAGAPAQTRGPGARTRPQTPAQPAWRRAPAGMRGGW